MKTEQRKKGGEDEGRKVTHSGWDRETGAGLLLLLIHHFDLVHDLRPQPLDA